MPEDRTHPEAWNIESTKNGGVSLNDLDDRDFRIVQVSLYVVLVSTAVASLLHGSYFLMGLFFFDALMAAYVTMVASNRSR